MKTSLVVTFAGTDRPGLVDKLAAAVRAHGANWERSRMARLAGHFAGILEVTVDGDVAPVEGALQAVGAAHGLAVRVDRGAQTPKAPARALVLELTGHDQPGIVAELGRALAERHLNIEELDTWCEEAPMAGGMLFMARAELAAPPGLALADLQEALDQIASQLSVEITLEARD